ncbi:MAG: transcription antitermination factor NusB, partial [Candidatus Bathyarchaeota archaeon]|nr:transcription antitermination factor NusB [Candidatus Bathyarchaeota archaeon]
MAYRHLSRSIAMQCLYERDFRKLSDKALKEIVERNIKEFGPGIEDTDFTRKIVSGVLEHLKEIDQVIEKCAPKFSLQQINIVDRNI